MFSLICVWIIGWVNNREAGDLRRYRAYYDVIVMWGFNNDVSGIIIVNARFVDSSLPCAAYIRRWTGSTLLQVMADGLSPDRCQAVTWTNAGLLPIALLGTTFSECQTGHFWARTCIMISRQWRHNWWNGISNHQPHHCLLNCLFRCRSKKPSKFHLTGIC